MTAAATDGPEEGNQPAHHADLLLRHGHIITMDRERRVLLDGSIAVADGRIVAVGPDHEVSGRYAGAAERDLRGCLVHPGFIDAHVHANSQELVRGFSPKDSADLSVVESALWAARSPEKDYLGALLACMEMVANGTTLFCDTGSSFYLEEAVRAIEAVGMRGIPGYFLVDKRLGIDPEYRKSPSFGSMPDEEVDVLSTPTEVARDRLREQLERYPLHDGARAHCAVTLFGCGRNSDALLTAAKELAQRHDVPMVMHWLWGPEEVTASVDEYGRLPVEHLADLGILGPDLTLVHMIHLSDEELALIAESGTQVVHCPAASMRRGMGAIRKGKFPEMLAAGVQVALGSDGFSGPRDLARQMYLAPMAFREVRGDIPVLTGETALEMATLHGARALGLADEVGSIEAGKRADLVVHAKDRPESHPSFHDPVDNLVFYRLSRTVDTVLVNGEPILDEGRFTRVDADDAYRLIDLDAARFAGELGPSRFATWPLIGS